MQVQHAISFFHDGDAFIAMIGRRLVRSSSDGLCHEIAPADQVVHGSAEAELPVDEASSPMTEFTRSPTVFNWWRRRSMLTIAPLSVTGGTGSPVNALATF